MNNLPPEIIDNHILPLLDGVTLTALSSVSSEFRRMIISKDELWKNICASAWPFLQSNINRVVSTFPSGYRSFFSDAFPSLHYSNSSNSNNNSQFHSIDLPPIDFCYFIDLYLEGELESYHHSPTGEITHFTFTRNGLHTKFEDYCEYRWWYELPFPEKIGGWMDYFQDNLRLTWIVIDKTRNCARSLFGPGSKPVSVQRKYMVIEVVYENVMPGQCEDYTVKCYMKVTCISIHGRKRTRVEIGMEDMNGNCVSQRHADMIILNAFQNGERKKF